MKIVNIKQDTNDGGPPGRISRYRVTFEHNGNNSTVIVFKDSCNITVDDIIDTLLLTIKSLKKQADESLRREYGDPPMGGFHDW